MKRVIKIFQRFDWNQAKDVDVTTLTNLITTIFCYSFTLISIIAAIFFGAWWQLIRGFFMYVLGAVCLNDTYLGNESALHYLERVFSK